MPRAKRKPTESPRPPGYRPNVVVPLFKKAGQPTKYNIDMCQAVINSMAQGKTKWEAAMDMGINDTTLYNWRDKHEDFAKALKMAERACEAWWIKLCRDESCSVEGAQVKGGAIMVMRNALKWDTRDKDKTDVVEEAKAILEMGAQMNNADWIKTYGPVAATKLKQVKTK